MPVSNLSYWHWFFRGSGGRPGFLRLLNWWLIGHICIGTILSFAVKAELQNAANTVLLPLAGIFIGLSFAWAGNAQALLQSSEMEEIARYHKGGFTEYVFVFQMAILMILVAMVLWGFAGLGIFDAHLPAAKFPKFYTLLKGALFTFSSFALRECWHVILGAQWMLLSQYEMKKARHSEGQVDKEKAIN